MWPIFIDLSSYLVKIELGTFRIEKIRKLYFSDCPFSEGGLFGVLGAFGFNLGVLTKIGRGRYRVVLRAPQGKFSCKTVFL